MAAGHSHRSVICKGIYVLPEKKPLTAVSFCPLAAGQVAQVTTESPTQGFRPSYNRGASGSLHSEIFTAFMFCLEEGFL